MKKFLATALPLLFLIAGAWAFASHECSKRSAWNRIKNPETVQMLKRFVAVKKAQAYADTNGVPPEIQKMFQYAERGNWQALSNLFNNIKQRDGWGRRPREGFWGKVEDFFADAAEKIGGRETKVLYFPRGAVGAAITETYGALDGFVTGDEKYSTAFGREIIDSIPAGSIYFGGSEPGRCIVAAMCKSQPDGNPFFILAQNYLADGAYRDDLRSKYGKKIYIPTENDQQKCVMDFMARIQARHQNQSPTPSRGAEAENDRNDDADDSSSVMNMNGLLFKVMFDACPTNQFFIEESFPIARIYRHLEPHGLIFKVDRQPLAELPAETIQNDREYWRNSLESKIGGWVTGETTLETIAAFATKTFLRHDFTSFTGDPRFVQNDYSCKMFSKERAAIAGLYAWRASHATNDFEKQRMTSEADFAFRQALAMCPYSPEAVYRYVSFLLSQNRTPDALLVAETAAQMPQNQPQRNKDEMGQLLTSLKKYQKEKSSAPSN